jgi:hypothetical protein
MIAAACAALALLASASAAEPPIWELRPYRVRVLVDVAARPEFTASLAPWLAARIETLQGGAWDAGVTGADESLRRAWAATSDGTLALESPPPLPKDALVADKVMLLRVTAADNGYHIAAREFDVLTGLWSATVARPVRQFEKVPDAALETLFQAFAPLARVSAVKDSRVVLRLRAAGLKPRQAPVAAGTVFRLATRSAYGEDPKRPAKPIPWTFCTVEEVDAEVLRGRLESGLRDPLAGDWETTLEVIALAVPRPAESTLLTLQAAAAAPLAGYDVLVSDAPAKAPVLLGRTDRQGTLRVPPGSATLRILSVRHGDEWLCRLPIVPGMEPRLTVSLAADEHGIDRAMFVAGVRDAAVDLAAQRDVLLSRLRACVAAKRREEAEQVAQELRQLPGVEEVFKARRAELAKDAPADRASQEKIEAAVKDLQKTLDAGLHAKTIDRLLGQLPGPATAAKTDAPPATKDAEPTK